MKECPLCRHSPWPALGPFPLLFLLLTQITGKVYSGEGVHQNLGPTTKTLPGAYKVRVASKQGSYKLRDFLWGKLPRARATLIRCTATSCFEFGADSLNIERYINAGRRPIYPYHINTTPSPRSALRPWEGEGKGKGREEGGLATPPPTRRQRTSAPCHISPLHPQSPRLHARRNRLARWPVSGYTRAVLAERRAEGMCALLTRPGTGRALSRAVLPSAGENGLYNRLALHKRLSRE